MSDVEDLQAFLQQQKVPDVYGLPELKAGNLRIQGPPVEGQYSQAEADKQAQDYPEETYAHHVGLPDIEGPDTGMPVPTKPGMQFEATPELTSTDDLKAFLDSRKDQDQAAIRQRATGILNQYRSDPNFHLPPEWYDSLVRESTAGTTPTGQVIAAAKGMGEAFEISPFGVPVPTKETTMAALGTVGGFFKSAGQFISEIGNPDVPRTVIRGAAAHGTASGLAGLDALVAGTEHAVASQFQDPEERIQALKQLYQADHENAATIGELDKLMGYQHGTAPGTEAAFEFGASTAPFAAMPGVGAAGKIIPNVASKLVEDVIPGVVGGVGRIAPAVGSASWKLAKFGAGFVPGVGKTIKITKGLGSLLEKLAPEASNFGEAAVKTPVFKFGDLMKGLTEAPEGMNVFEPMQQGVKEEIVRLNKSFDLQAKAAGEKVNINSVKSVEPNGKFTVDAEHLNPAEQKLRAIQQQLTDQRSKFDTLERYSKIMNLGKDAAKLGIGQGLTLGAGGATMGGIAAITAMPDDVERAAMEGVPTGMALTTPALLPEAIKTMQVSRSGRIKAAGDYQAHKGSQVPTHPDAAQLSTQGQRAVNIVNGSIWEGGGQAVPVTREKMADLTGSKPETAPMGFYDKDTMTAYLRDDAVERYGQNGPVGHEFTHALDSLTGDTAKKAYGTILDGVKDPAVGFRLQDFLYNYMSALRRSDPTAKTLSVDSLMSEGAAELARYILAKTPLEELMSGKTYQKVISDKIGDAIAAVTGKSDEVFTAPGFGTPFTREQYRAMENAIYDWGKQVRRGDVMRPEVPGAAPVGPEVVIPKEVSKLNAEGKWNIPDEFLKQAVQRAAPNAAPADILIDALKASKEGAKPTPTEAPEGKVPVDEWKAEADRKVKEFVDQGIPETQAVMQAADYMQDWEKNRQRVGRLSNRRLMPEIAPQTEEFKRWSGEAPVVLDAGLREPTRDQLGLRMENAVGGGYNITDGQGNKIEGPIAHIQLASDTMFHIQQRLMQERLSQENAGKFQSGQPVVVGAYHGTPSGQFHVFDENKLGTYTGAPSAGEGFFFSGLPDTARAYQRTGLKVPVEGYKNLESGHQYALVSKLMDAADHYNYTENPMWRMEHHWAREGRQSVEKWAVMNDLGERITSNLTQDAAEAMINAHNSALPPRLNVDQFIKQFPAKVKKLAEDLTGKEFDMTPSDASGHMHEVYVKFQNPFVYDFRGNPYREESYYNLLKQAKAQGHDGAIFTNTYDGGGKPDNIFVSFKNKNIKSTENVGTFDPHTADIRYMPQPDNPDAIKGAAIKLPDGRILTGAWHGVIDKQVPPEFKGKGIDGFVTGNDRFLTRDEAWVVGKRFGQIPKYARPLNKDQLKSGEQTRPQLISEDIRPSAYMPDVGDFQKLAKDAGYEFQGDLDGVLFWKHPDTGREITAEPWRGRENAIADFKDKLSGKYVPGQDVYRTSKQDLYGKYGERSRLKREGEEGGRYMPDNVLDFKTKAEEDLRDTQTLIGDLQKNESKLINQIARTRNPDKQHELQGQLDELYRKLDQAESHEATAMYTAGHFMPEVNIGMHVGGEEKLTSKDVADALEAVPGVKILKLSEQRKEGAEPTVVATLSRALTPKEGDAVSKALDQESIAQHQVGGQGDLFGPQAEKWGPFNPEYFVTHDGRLLTEALKDRLPTRTGASGIWDRMTVDPNFMEGEFEHAVEATGANPKERFYRQTPAAQKAITDYFMGRGEAQFMPDVELRQKANEYLDKRSYLLSRVPDERFEDVKFDLAEYIASDKSPSELSPLLMRSLERAGLGIADLAKIRADFQDKTIPVQFMPNPHPDAIKESAIKMKDGKIFTAGIHADAEDKALNAGYGMSDLIHSEHGFVDNRDRFVDRLEGQKRSMAQFMPNPHPEALKEAAVQMKDGKVFTGPLHSYALERAREYYGSQGTKAMNRFLKWEDDSRYTDGYVNNKGDFLNREQAYDTARRLEQIPEHWQHSPLAQPYEMGPSLESTMFEDMRRFMPNPHPEAIQSAAWKRSEDGKVITGTSHPTISDEYGAFPRGTSIAGFVTKTGKFLDRNEAADHAALIGQALMPQHGYLESMSFNADRKFMPNPHPDAIKEPAFRTPDGEVIHAPVGYHSLIPLTRDQKLQLGKLEPGFISNKHTDERPDFMNRKQALARALKHKQITEAAADPRNWTETAIDEQLHAPDVTEGTHPPWQYMPDVPTDKKLKDALSEDKASKIGAHRDLPKGTPVSLRIDIPAYNKTGDYAVTVHDRNIGKVHGYDGIATVDNPTFYVQEKGAQKVKEGMAKYPMAAVNGDFNPSRTIPKDINDYAKVGFNPVKHSYFYDKSTGDPVISGDKAISAGNTVYVKNPVYGNPAGFLYMPDMPTAIDRAALRNKETGEIITGGQNDTHFMIPASSGKADDYLGPNGHKIYEEGFVSQAGYWYDREQAHTQMKALGQLPLNYQGEYKDELNVTDLRKGRQAQMMPDNGFIGHVTDEGNIEGEKVQLGTGGAQHEKLGYNDFQWRYNPETKSAYWWGKPEQAEKDALKEWLGRRGQDVEKHVSLSTAELGPMGFSKAFGEAHGMDLGKTVPQDMGVHGNRFTAGTDLSKYDQGMFMPNTPAEAHAQTAAEAAKFPEAKPLRWQKEDNGDIKIKYNTKTRKDEAVPLQEGYNLINQPLSVQAGEGLQSKDAKFDAATDKASDGVVKEFQVAKKNPEAMQAKGWYSELKDKLLGKLGGNMQDLILFTRLLATTSPNTNPGVNFGFALDAWNRFQKGEYKDVIDRYNTALADYYQGKLKHSDGRTVVGLKDFNGYLYGNDIIPYASEFHEKTTKEHKAGDPKKLGMHSLRVLDTLSDHYDRINGLKINQFAHNLAQTDLQATIDLWAARTLHRLMNGDSTDSQWRILPMNEKGISDADFKFGQAAFKKAATKLNISPDDLQAIMWFHEKMLYDKRGWSAYLDKGDFRPLVDRMEPTGINKNFRLADVAPPSPGITKFKMNRKARMAGQPIPYER